MTPHHDPRSGVRNMMPFRRLAIGKWIVGALLTAGYRGGSGGSILTDLMSCMASITVVATSTTSIITTKSGDEVGEVSSVSGGAMSVGGAGATAGEGGAGAGAGVGDGVGGGVGVGVGVGVDGGVGVGVDGGVGVGSVDSIRWSALCATRRELCDMVLIGLGIVAVVMMIRIEVQRGHRN